MHGVAGALVGTTDTQTLTNKTLTAPVVEGDLTLNNGSFVGTRLHAALELGANGTDNNPLIDFHTGRNSDYDVRIQASPAGGGGVGLGLLGISAGGLQVNGDEVVRQVATQTLTNKTLALGSNSLSGTLAQLNTAITDADVASLAGTETLTNKTIDLTDNTLTGTLAEFSAAVSDADLVGVASSQTLTNKTLSGPTINGGTLNGVTVTGASSIFTASAGGMGVNAGLACEIILGYAGSGGLSIAQAGVATHGNGVVLWVSGNSLYARHSNGGDSLIS